MGRKDKRGTNPSGRYASAYPGGRIPNPLGEGDICRDLLSRENLYGSSIALTLHSLNLLQTFGAQLRKINRC